MRCDVVMQLMSDEQIIRMGAQQPHTPVMPSTFPLLLALVDGCFNVKAPRLPLPIPEQALNKLISQRSATHTRKRARSRSPGPHQHASQSALQPSVKIASAQRQLLQQADRHSGLLRVLPQRRAHELRQTPHLEFNPRISKSASAAHDRRISGAPAELEQLLCHVSIEEMLTDLSADQRLADVRAEQMLVDSDTAAVCPSLTDLLDELLQSEEPLPDLPEHTASLCSSEASRQLPNHAQMDWESPESSPAQVKSDLLVSCPSNGMTTSSTHGMLLAWRHNAALFPQMNGSVEPRFGQMLLCLFTAPHCKAAHHAGAHP